MQLTCFMMALLFIPIGLWQFGRWLFTVPAPSFNQTTEVSVALDRSQLYIWRSCPRGRKCYDNFRLCVKSSQLPSPESAYCFFSTTWISKELHDLKPGTLATLLIAPDLDRGRKKILRFWELKIENKPSLNFSRITHEHNNTTKNFLLSSFIILAVGLVSAVLYRRTLKPNRY